MKTKDVMNAEDARNMTVEELRSKGEGTQEGPLQPPHAEKPRAGRKPDEDPADEARRSARRQ